MSVFWILITLILTTALVVTTFTSLKYREYLKTCTLVAFISITSLTLYQHWGAPKDLHKTYQLAEQINHPDQLAEKLKNHLEANPNNPEGWRLLSRLYTTLDEHTLAKEATQKANQPT